LCVRVAGNSFMDHLGVFSDSSVGLFSELTEVRVDSVLNGIDNVGLADVLTVEGDASGRLDLVDKCLAVHS